MFSATERCGASSDSWCTMAMPMAAASAGRLSQTSAPLPEHAAAVALEHARHDLHEGGLAGAVLAQQQVDLARAHGQVAVAQRRHAAEAFLDALEFEEHGN